MRTRFGWAAVVVLATAGVALASRGWGEYDDTKGMSLRGVIHSTAFERPYLTLQLDVEKPQPRSWTVVLGSPSKLESKGVAVSSLAPGTVVTVYVYPSRDVPDECRALRITLGGKTTELW
jgi:Family of unknown function (DUF6152)